MTPGAKCDLLEVLERAPDAAFDLRTLTALTHFPRDTLATRRLRPAWLTDAGLPGLSPLGLIAVQVASGGHWDRLEQAWHLLRRPEDPVVTTGPLPEGGLVWLAAGLEADDRRRATMVEPLMASADADALWQAAWRVSEELRTQNAVDLEWGPVALGWATACPHRLPSPTAATAATLAFDMMRAGRPRFEDALPGLTDPTLSHDPLLAMIARHLPQPEEAGAWLARWMQHRRKPYAAVDDAITLMVQRGSSHPLPARASALTPRAHAAARERRAGVSEGGSPSRLWVRSRT